MDSPLNLVDFYDSRGVGYYLDYRTSQLSSSQALGQPDLCYFICETRRPGLIKYLKKSSTKAYYHFVYGLNTSSSENIQNYLKSFEKTMKKSKWKISTMYYCVYDLFSKFDLRIEITGTAETHYLINCQSKRIQAGNIHWQGAYVSSVLRFLYTEPIPGSRLLDGPLTVNEVENFVEISAQFLDRVGFVIGDNNDTCKYRENLLFAKFSNYLLKYKRFKQHNSFFRKLSQKDPMMVFYLCKSYIKLRRFEEIIDITTCQISITPFAFPLYFLKAYAHYRLNEYKEARSILQYLIELNLEVFCFWECLCWCYIKEKKYEAAFLCLNCFPIYESEQKNKADYPTDDELMIPQKIPTSSAWNIWNRPLRFDFKTSDDTKPWTSSEEGSLERLKSLQSARLTHCEKKLYKILVYMEKHVEWENLLKFKKKLFMQNNGTLHERDKFSMTNISSQEILRRNVSLATSDFDTIGLESEIQTEGIYDQNFYGSAITPRDYFITPSNDNRLAHLMHPSMRTVSKKLTDLLSYMYLDLKALYEWQKQAAESDALQDQNRPSTLTNKGEIWIRRGALAERMQRSRLAERAYRHVLDSGFSLYALYRLMKLNVRSGNPKSAVSCIVQILKQIEIEKFIFDTEFLPPWLGMILAEICSSCGYRQLYSLAVETEGNNYPILMRSIEALKYWNTDGSHKK
ncbi:BUD7_4 [Blepharisma stoltei]|uniref:Uncharacterized protein n=1 Tax=Blepharisma stoltei TaxID=1481888 RepID=A0AAU9JXX4_9CILI|nr:unnamed protein product [Blepharisma stoltei]